MINYSGQDSYTSSTVQSILLASDYIIYNGGSRNITSIATHPHYINCNFSGHDSYISSTVQSHISGILLHLTASIVVDVTSGYVMILHPHIRYIATNNLQRKCQEFQQHTGRISCRCNSHVRIDTPDHIMIAATHQLYY